jgi:type IV secretory pathway ATPase VirB11/archaellum biosynthesis ATPase
VNADEIRREVVDLLDRLAHPSLDQHEAMLASGEIVAEAMALREQLIRRVSEPAA